MNAFEKQIEDLQTEVRTRVEAVERSFEEVKKLGGIKGDQGERGTRGPAGDIYAAVQNAELKATEITKSAADSLDAKFKGHTTNVEAQLTAIRAEVLAAKAQLAETIKNAVDNALVNVLQEFQVLDKDNNLHVHAVAHALGKLGVPYKPYVN